MIKRLDNIKLNIRENEGKLFEIVKKRAGGRIGYFKILKKSLDARDKSNLFWVYSVAYSEREEKTAPRDFEKISSPKTVVIVGGGPAGLFCAVRLIEHGFAPVIVERGERVEERKISVDGFVNGGSLNLNSNVQFGEGGAGAFSDGKLNTRTHDGLNADVLEIFHRFGAPEEILYLNKPHVGSDNLYAVLQNLRRFVEKNGGKYLFNTIFECFTENNGRLRSVILKNAVTGETSEIPTEIAVLALGHSARDTFEMLAKQGVQMQPCDFAVGVRIEHLAESISLAQYGKDFRLLPTADYKLVSHAHERTVFTFCMCPGGVVIPSASEEGGVVTNGMSLYARDGKNSNSAVMVQMKRADFGEGLFDGMNFQRKIEQNAYKAGGGNFRAPVQLFKDFLRDKVSQSFGEVTATYGAGTVFAPLSEVLPPVAVSALKKAIPDMDRRLKGFASGDAVLTGAETRFTSPVKILRDKDGESVTVKGLYPCGEGSGYSGGITSSASDGLGVAEKIFRKLSQ